MLVNYIRKLKQSIFDASDLVSKRRKCPCSALTAWKASQISRLSSGFSMPLMSCKFMRLLSGFLKVIFHLEKQKVLNFNFQGHYFIL